MYLGALMRRVAQRAVEAGTKQAIRSGFHRGDDLSATTLVPRGW
jgi:hypothetical protein